MDVSLFRVTHYYFFGNKLYLIGLILQGELKDYNFSVEYNEISKNEYINSSNTEADIYFKYNDIRLDKYYHLGVGLNKNEINPKSIGLTDLNNFIKINKFSYIDYMNPVAYIIMSGMIITGI